MEKVMCWLYWRKKGRPFWQRFGYIGLREEDLLHNVRCVLQRRLREDRDVLEFRFCASRGEPPARVMRQDAAELLKDFPVRTQAQITELVSKPELAY